MLEVQALLLYHFQIAQLMSTIMSQQIKVDLCMWLIHLLPYHHQVVAMIIYMLLKQVNLSRDPMLDHLLVHAHKQILLTILLLHRLLQEFAIIINIGTLLHLVAYYVKLLYLVVKCVRNTQILQELSLHVHLVNMDSTSYQTKLSALITHLPTLFVCLIADLHMAHISITLSLVYVNGVVNIVHHVI
jgi:hypothetical protein